jgi:Restriction endonuclease
MGFFDSFAKSLNDNKKNKEIIDIYNDSEDSNYRNTALENSNSNYGWYTCSKCGRKFRKDDMDADHIIPKSYGGDNSRENLQLLCYHCNRSKSNNMDDSYKDLSKRRSELDNQDKDDLKFLNNLSKTKRR